MNIFLSLFFLKYIVTDVNYLLVKRGLELILYFSIHFFVFKSLYNGFTFKVVDIFVTFSGRCKVARLRFNPITFSSLEDRILT
jgi:hypothetical protein